jgi:hypothetical protein
MEHLPSRPDLDLCHFFLFRDMKEQLKGRSFAEEEEFLSLLDFKWKMCARSIAFPSH